MKGKSKGKFHPVTCHVGTGAGGRDIAALSLTLVVNTKPRLFAPGKETRYPFCRRWCGPRGRSGRVRKISPPYRCSNPESSIS